ncbi:Hypothetical protein PHPALM_20200 [Phytophthora palmivora]|uniref:Peptidase A2 domain-containing protein n=1 Tax=Phytophthora palmivora TaxID=4796 RepID=A0A2P4XFG0_9STRA|nr:Hypothetical protein PHPALM_20200 [Phytophthora palmivora]
MKTRSNWMQLFGPKLVRQAVWMDLGGELAVPIDSTSTRQVAQDTVLLLRAMGCEPQRFPSDAALKDWTPTDAGTALRKWKKKLRTSFEVSEIGAGRQLITRREPEATDPSKVTLPQTPKKRVNEGSDAGVFTTTAEASPYMQDSHMVTPRSTSRSERLAKETESLRPTPNTRQETGRYPTRNYDSPEDTSDSDSDSSDFDYLDGDLTEEWARQIRELSKAKTKSSTPRLELATHLPLGNIKPYFGLRNKSEKSMQWLRTFIYEMKGTHTPPNEWCMVFELSLQDGALHWYRQLPRKTCRTWKLLSDAFIKYYCLRFTQSAKARYYSAKREDKEHVCDYLNRLNGYARNAGVQFENGERDAKDYVEHFLDTCDDRGLEERLCHVRVKDIHDLEDMVNDILRRREPTTNGAGTAAEVPVKVPIAILVPTVNTVMLQPPMTSNAAPLQKEHLPGPTTDTPGVVMVTSTKTEATDETTDSANTVLVQPLTQPAIDADYMFAFAGEVNWPEDREITSVKTMENEKERGAYLSECGMKEWSSDEPSGRKTEGSIASMSRVEQSPRGLVPRTKLLPGERLGWWSSQRNDKKKRMRALVKGAVNDVRTRILLDTGANVSVISANYAKRLRLRDEDPDHGRTLEVRGINPGVLETRRRALVKMTLGWERVYEFEMWIMNHSAGVDVALGTDFMIPAGVRLDLFHGTARLQDEYKEWQILAYAESRDETLFERERELYECWLAEQPPAVERREYPTPRNIITRDAEDSGPVGESQVYCAEDMTQATDTTSRECGRHDNSLAFRAVADASDGVAVERIPTEESEHRIPVSESGDRVFEQARRQSSTHATDDALCTEASNGVTSENIGASDQILDEPDDRAIHTPCSTEDPECILNATYVSAMHEIAAGVVSGRDPEENDVSEHLVNDIELTDYAQELAFLPDLTEITITALDYTGPNVQNKDLDVGQQQQLVDVLKRHEKIMISSGNALPPPAYGVVCDIDVQEHAPIKQRARRTPLRFLGKLSELLKGLLRAVNSVTAIMAYAMSLVDDLLTDMEAYLWFCSLNAASGFWAIMMTQRARKISAFVCALGYFEWLRMPFGLKNAPMIYQRMIDNALWGFVQPRGGWSQFAKAMHEAEEQTKDARTVATEDCNQHSEAPPRARTKFEADRESSTVMDTVSLLVNSPTGDMFANGESDESSLVPRRWTDCSNVSQSWISVSSTKSIFVQSKVDFLSHEVSSEGIRADPKKIKAVTEAPFPTSKKGMQSFLGALNYYSRFIQDFALYGAALYQLKDADFTPG